MFHGTDRRTQWDLYLEAMERRQRRLERGLERGLEPGSRVWRGLVLACLLGVMVFVLLLAL